MDRVCDMHGERKCAYRVLVRIPEGKRPFGKPRHRWEDIRMVLKKNQLRAWTRLLWLRIRTSGGLF
jgi:hypothetical protein